MKYLFSSIFSVNKGNSILLLKSTTPSQFAIYGNLLTARWSYTCMLAFFFTTSLQAFTHALTENAVLLGSQLYNIGSCTMYSLLMSTGYP